MSLFYSDNTNRAARVGDLANDITFMQSEMVETNGRMRDSDKKAYALLEGLAKSAHCSSTEDYIAKALDALSPEDRASYLALRDKVRKTNDNCIIAFEIIGVFAAIGATMGILSSSKVMTFFNYGYRVVGFRVIGEGIDHDVAGQGGADEAFADAAQDALRVDGAAVNADVQFAREAEVELAEVDAAMVVAESITEVTTAMKVVSVVSKALGAAAILASIGTLIFDAVIGAKQKAQLQQATLDLASKRFGVKRLQMRLDQSLDMQVDIHSFMKEKATFDELVAAHTISKDVADSVMTKASNDLAVKYHDVITSLLAGLDVQAALKPMDCDSWTNEDPDVDTMTQYIKDHDLKTDS